MKVVIDDVRYVPQGVTPTDQHQAALAVEIATSDAGDDITIREYLQTLLMTLWEKEEEFSGKRPFGNSGWQNEPIAALVKAGFIKGTTEEGGYSEPDDWNMATAFVLDLIMAMCAA